METEKRLLLAVVLMMAVVFVVNVFFFPSPPPAPTGRDTTVVAPADTTGMPAGDTVRRTVERGPPEPGPDETPRETFQIPGQPAEEGRRAVVDTVPEDTIWVTGPLYRLGFASRGARLVHAELLEFESLAPGSHGDRVQLIPAGGFNLLTHGWVVGDDTLDLEEAEFEVAPSGGLTLEPGDTARTLVFTYRHPGTDFRFEAHYRFRPDRYLLDLEGRLVGAPATGWWRLGLGTGFVSPEWDPEEDYENNLSFAARGPEGMQSQKIKDVGADGRVGLDGPFDWAAVRTKYFVGALVVPGAEQERRLAGVQIQGTPEPYRARATVSFPVGRDGRFAYHLYLGPQDYGRLSAVGHELDEVTPYGYKWLQPVIRPLVGAITDLLVWSHNVLAINYGWILILFGVAIRVILFPLYQKSMRAQLATMRVQPLMKEIQNKYKDEPQRMQQEMMKLYKEHKINPLGGCLPMLLPFPILIALFFVFRDTIEFRGVPFLWLPDLSRPDPLYIIPVLMGLSVFLLQWVGQRNMPQSNPQMKILMWVMPIFLTILFLNFASGLNLYYATMNLASIPQQLYLAKERAAAAERAPVKAKAKA